MTAFCEFAVLGHPQLQLAEFAVLRHLQLQGAAQQHQLLVRRRDGDHPESLTIFKQVCALSKEIFYSLMYPEHESIHSRIDKGSFPGD